VVVSYGDLNLQSERGRQALDRRIKQAVHRVCASRPHISQLQQHRAYVTCETDAWRGANQQLAQVLGGARLASASIEVSSGAD
jgi:UrcA family protein